MEKKCRLFVPLHTAPFATNALISHGRAQLWETKVIYVGKKQKANGNGEHRRTVFLRLLQVCFYGEEGRRCYWCAVASSHLAGCLQMIILYIYMWLICFHNPSFCLAFLAPVLGWKAARTRWKMIWGGAEGVKKKGGMCEKIRGGAQWVCVD